QPALAREVSASPAHGSRLTSRTRSTEAPPGRSESIRTTRCSGPGRGGVSSSRAKITNPAAASVSAISSLIRPPPEISWTQPRPPSPAELPRRRRILLCLPPELRNRPWTPAGQGAEQKYCQSRKQTVFDTLV